MSNPTPKRPDQSVPLVIYKGRERIVIGSCFLKGDGSIEGQIAKDVRKELKDLLFGNMVGDISLNPKQSTDSQGNSLSILVDATTREAIEAAVVPPLKIRSSDAPKA